MKTLKTVLLTVAILVGFFTTITFTACKSDPCKKVSCQNGGSCNDGKCTCPAGYEGALCENYFLSKFLGPNNTAAVYSVSTNGATGCVNSTSDITISRNIPDTTYLKISNIHGLGSTSYVIAQVSGNIVTVPIQIVNGQSNVSIKLDGVYSNGVITGDYSLNVGGVICNYIFTYTKK